MATAETAATLAVLNSDSGKELTRRAGEIFSNLLGPVTEQLGLTLGDHAAYYRLKKLVALGEKAQKLLDGRRVADNPNLGRILPIIQIASMESDDDLHTRWAALLANVLSEPNNVHPSYIEILKQLTSAEARWLDQAFEEAAIDEKEAKERLDRDMPKYAGNGFTPKRQVRQETLRKTTTVMLGNLKRLGLLHEEIDDTDDDGLLSSLDQMYVSDFGRAFIKACRAEST